MIGIARILFGTVLWWPGLHGNEAVAYDGPARPSRTHAGQFPQASLPSQPPSKPSNYPKQVFQARLPNTSSKHVCIDAHMLAELDMQL